MPTTLAPKRPRRAGVNLSSSPSPPPCNYHLAFSPPTVVLSNCVRRTISCSSCAFPLQAQRVSLLDPCISRKGKHVSLSSHTSPSRSPISPPFASPNSLPTTASMTPTTSPAPENSAQDISEHASAMSTPAPPASASTSASPSVSKPTEAISKADEKPSTEEETKSDISFSAVGSMGENNSARVAWNKGKKRSEETRRKISYTMLGQRKSQSMRDKLSESMKGRIPWNKGKKLSPETRARMSAAHVGRHPWNKATRLTKEHRVAISESNLRAQRKLSEETRRRMRMARRRPGDALVSGSSTAGSRDRVGSYGLVDGAGINEYILLRRQLRIWSDGFVKRNSRRPTLADIRRLAPVPVMRKFEKYVKMRDQIRGLAGDVYGNVDPDSVPVVPTKDVADAPRNNNAGTTIHTTKHGNQRLISSTGVVGAESVGYNNVGDAAMKGALEDMWDMYDRPSSWEHKPTTEVDNTLIGTHELYQRQASKHNDQKDQKLSANDFRKIGRYRLMGAMDINHYTDLRKELQGWSLSFKNEHGRTPTLSDAKVSSKSWLYGKFCEYLEMRDRMFGLVEEVYGTAVDDVETLKKVNEEGKEVLDTLLRKSKDNNAEHTASPSPAPVPVLTSLPPSSKPVSQEKALDEQILSPS